MDRRLIGVLIVAVAVAAGAGWFWLEKGVEEPGSSVEGVASGGGGTGAPLAEVTVPEVLSAKAQSGEIIYDAACASCHGANAAGQDGVAPPLVHRIYEPSHHGDMAFVLAARNGVRAHHWSFGDMPPVEQRMTDAEVGLIVAYVREMQRANGIN